MILYPVGLKSIKSNFYSTTTQTTPPSKQVEPSVILEKRLEDRIAIITLNDPKRLNALTSEMGDELVEIVKHLSTEECEGIGAVVIRGAGNAFSAGGDLHFLRARMNDTPSRNSVIVRQFYEKFLSIREIPVPVIAAVNGVAVGAGVGLMLACDLRVTCVQAKIGFTFTKLGLHPGMGSSYFLPKLIGAEQAAKLLLTGDTIPGREAYRLGLVSDLCDTSEECIDHAIALAMRVASSAPLAVRTCVRSLRMQDLELERALWRETDCQAECWNSQDAKIGIDAVVEKKTPVFTQWEGYSDKE